MNYKVILSVLGKVMLLMAFFLLIPMLVGIIYSEDQMLAFLYPIIGLIVVGVICSFIKIENKELFAKEGLVVVALAWIILSIVGALPFVISGEIPSFVDALFETASGFTTTGATVLSDVETLSHGMQFWRIFTHWIGGMGVLVFLLAIIPSASGVMHIFRAESPGPESSKLVSKMSFTARILYAIYIVFTIIQIIMLLCGGLSFYDSVLTAFSTAGTGGFSMYNDSVAHFNSLYIEIVVAVFMFLFGINFNVFFLILIKQFKKAISSEEVRVYFIIVAVATISIAINILSLCANFGEAIRYAFFQVTSVSSTTGFATTNYGEWPAFSKSILTFLMIMGACGGSTGGGFKVARLIIVFKSASKDVKNLLHPRAITSIRFEGEPLERKTERSVRTYTVIWLFLVIVGTILVSLDYNDLFTNISATLSCIGNVGPVLNTTGSMFNFGCYSIPSKLIFSFLMLAGRLEIFPLIILCSPRTWKK